MVRYRTGTLPYGTVQYGAVWYHTVVRYSTVRYGTVQSYGEIDRITITVDGYSEKTAKRETLGVEVRRRQVRAEEPQELPRQREVQPRRDVTLSSLDPQGHLGRPITA